MAKKISLIAVSVVALAIIVAITVLGFVKTTYRPDFATPFKYEVVAVESNLNGGYYSENKNKEKFEEINNAFNNGFKESKLNSIFSGRNGYNKRIERITDKLVFQTGYQLTLSYLENQILTVDGETYYHVTNSTRKIEYKNVIINITEEKGLNVVELYYENEYTDKDGDKETHYYKQSVYANFEDVYNFIADQF